MQCSLAQQTHTVGKLNLGIKRDGKIPLWGGPQGTCVHTSLLNFHIHVLVYRLPIIQLPENTGDIVNQDSWPCPMMTGLEGVCCIRYPDIRQGDYLIMWKKKGWAICFP